MPEKVLSKAIQPLTIKVEINQDGLKKLVEKGKLTSFMDSLSAAVGTEIKAQTVEHLVNAAIAKTAIGGISISAYFDDDDFWFGNGPRHPWPRGSVVLPSVTKSTKSAVGSPSV